MKEPTWIAYMLAELEKADLEPEWYAKLQELQARWEYGSFTSKDAQFLEILYSDFS